MAQPRLKPWEALLDRAETAIEEGDLDEALALSAKAEAEGGEAAYFGALVHGDALLAAGDAEEALQAYERAAGLSGGDPEVDCARGWALFELLRVDEAERSLRAAVEAAPEFAEAHYALGLTLELAGRPAASASFERAARLDPELFAPAPSLTAADFEHAVAEALEAMPPVVRQALENIAVLIEDLPALEDLRGDPPLSPRALGMFVGTPPAQRSVMDPIDGPPPAIILFKRNLERAFPDAAELVDEIRVTVLHEVGHALGLSEDDLVERGLD